MRGCPTAATAENHVNTRAPHFPAQQIKTSGSHTAVIVSVQCGCCGVAIVFSNGLGIHDIVVAFGPKQFFGPIVVHVAPLARLRGGMDAHAEERAVPAGKLRQLSSGKWYVHCRWCDEEARLEAPNEEEAYGMLHEWRLSMPRRKYQQRNWSCPRCAEWWQGTTPTATDTLGSAGQPAAKRAILLPNLRNEVQQLKAEVVEMKGEVDKWTELGKNNVTYKVAQVDEIRKLRRESKQLRAQVTAVPDGYP